MTHERDSRDVSLSFWPDTTPTEGPDPYPTRRSVPVSLLLDTLANTTVSRNDAESILQALLRFFVESGAYVGTAASAVGGSPTDTVLPNRMDAVSSGFDRVLRTLDAGLETTGVRDAGAEYLFKDPLPETVPVAWLAEVRSYRAKDDDPGFVLPWNLDEESPEG
jgi:hypothetical protein